MTWNLVHWVWRLESPLFIGMPPAGSLNRCRLYVPARAVHGAVTAEIARLHGDKPDYGKFGREIGLNCLFTYLYPAEKIDNDYLAWLPEFVEGKGLVWRRRDDRDGNEELSDREFRMRLMDTRAGTAIAPSTDSAADGTLRETECINPWWKRTNRQSSVSDRVYLVGYLFLKNNYLNGNSQKISGPNAGKKQVRLRDITTLYLGGDTRYGLGKICLEVGLTDSENVFGRHVHLDRASPKIESEVVWGHAPVAKEMIGAQEQFDGWQINSTYKGQLAWIPGSRQQKGNSNWKINNYGLWEN